MARQNHKDVNRAVGLAQLAALVVLYSVLLPSDRDLLSADVLIPVGGVGLVLITSLIALLISNCSSTPGSSKAATPPTPNALRGSRSS